MELCDTHLYCGLGEFTLTLEDVSRLKLLHMFEEANVWEIVLKGED